MKRNTNYAAFENKVIEIPVQLNARLKGLKHSKELILVNLPCEDEPLPGGDKSQSWKVQNNDGRSKPKTPALQPKGFWHQEELS